MRSMTAYARAAAVTPVREGQELCEICVEMRSVNNRYLDLSTRLPRSLAGLEDRVKATLTAAGITRGKLEVTVTLTVRDATAGATANATVGATSATPLEPDLIFAKRVVEAADRLASELGVPNDLTVSKLLTMLGVLVPVKPDETATEDENWARIEPVLADATKQFLAAREKEGERLGADMLGKISRIRELAAELAAGSEADIGSLRTRFEERLRTLIGQSGIQPDEARVITECAIFADRLSVDEELVRLASHLDTLEALLRSEEAVGRKIDFMLQETNREINTIGSKCANAGMARLVAEVKNELEKLREQVQNIE